MDLPPAVAPMVAAFADALRARVGPVALYVGGSLTTHDFHLGISDLDLAAIVAAPLAEEEARGLRTLHEQMAREAVLAEKPHCVYVPVAAVTDVAAPHLYWAQGALYRRALTGVARAELLRHGFTVFGRPPATFLPAVSGEALLDAVRGELSGYWSGAIRKPWPWVEDACVDLGLVTLARVEATLTERRLITKREAITRLSLVGVPPDIAREIGRRRRGEPVAIGRWARIRRAYRARRVMAAGIRALLDPVASQSAPKCGAFSTP